MRLMEFVGGTLIEEMARRLASHAQQTGQAAYCLSGNTFITANPGQTAEKVLARFREDEAVKSEWFQSADGKRFLENLRAPA